jgi:hypothetical protein
MSGRIRNPLRQFNTSERHRQKRPAIINEPWRTTVLPRLVARLKRMAITGRQLSFGGDALTNRPGLDSESDASDPLGKPRLAPGLLANPFNMVCTGGVQYSFRDLSPS